MKEERQVDPGSRSEPGDGSSDRTTALVVLLVLLIWLATPWWLPPLAAVAGFDRSLGEFGDQFGAINALFTGLAMLWVGFTLRFQTQELQLQRAARMDEVQRQRQQENASRRQQLEASVESIISVLARRSPELGMRTGQLKSTIQSLTKTISEVQDQRRGQPLPRGVETPFALLAEAFRYQLRVDPDGLSEAAPWCELWWCGIERAAELEQPEEDPYLRTLLGLVSGDEYLVVICHTIATHRVSAGRFGSRFETAERLKLFRWSPPLRNVHHGFLNTDEVHRMLRWRER